MYKTINQTAVFVIELIMIGTFGYVGFRKANSMLAKYSSAFILPLLVIWLWSYFAAPKSSHRLQMPYLQIFRIVLFLAASYLLYEIDLTNMAIGLALVSIYTQIASFFLND